MRRGIGPTSKARAARARERLSIYRRVCVQVDKRDGDVCRACSQWVGDARHHHHIVFRSQRGTDTLDTLLVLCARCHEAVHQHTLTITGDGNSAVFTR